MNLAESLIELPLPQLVVQGRGVQVCYQDVVALSVSQLVFRGHTIAIVGQNGAGKSTLIKAMLNLLPLNKGILTLKQHEGRKSTVLDPAQHMAFCPESGAVFADISVESYLKLWCRIKPVSYTHLTLPTT